MFSSKSFIALVLISKSMTHLYMVLDKGCGSFFAYGYSILPALFVRLFCLHRVASVSLPKHDCIYVNLFLDSLFCSTDPYVYFKAI